MKNFVFLGAPGVGKGTMSTMICEDQGYTHISTGDLLRAEVAADTRLGGIVRGFMEAGELVPDSLVADLLTQTLGRLRDEAVGFIFDGYPRTLPQANLLQQALAENQLSLTGVVLLEASEATILERLTGRRLCRACGAIFHLVFRPPKQDGICDACGGEIYQRSDDNENSVRQRLVAYEKQTTPLIDYYAQRERLIRVDASQRSEANYHTLSGELARWIAGH